MATSMNRLETLRLSRRSFLVQSGIVTCGVAFGSGCSRDAEPTARASALGNMPGLAPNPWVTLHNDGSIEIIAPGIELGQGSMTTLPRYVAEELDADWKQVRVVAAPVNEKLYGNPLFWGIQVTAGSRTCLGYFDVMRSAGAQARYVLMQTAARAWKVPFDQLSTENSSVMHAGSQRRIAYAELVDSAKVPKEFPEFIAPDGRRQEPDDFFGDFPWTPAPPSATRPPPVKLKSWKSFKLLGVDTPRVDIPDKVKGAAKYGIDIQIPGMVCALVETSPVLGAAPDRINDAEVRQLPGIVDVVSLPYGVAVVASDITSAYKGREHLKVSWKPLTGTRYDSEQVLDEYSQAARDVGENPGVRAFELGDAAATQAALAEGTPLVFETRSHLVYHATLEPQNAILRLAPDGKSAEAWVSTQWPGMEQGFAAKVLGIPPESIKINMTLVGGGFGRRAEPGAIIDAAHIARKTGKPVKVLWTREDDLKRNPHRQALVCRIEAAVTAQGTIRAMRSRVVGDSWFVRVLPELFKQYNDTDPGNWIGARHLYDVPLQIIDNITERRSVDVCYLRGIGCTQTKFALESLIDEIAERSQKDPLDYRLEMLKKAPRAANVLRTAADMAQWTTRRPTGRALGLAYTGYGNGHAALVAEVSVDRSRGDVRVHEVWSAVDVGFAVQPAIVASQMEGGILQGISMALFEQVTYREGAPQETNFQTYRILRMSETPRLNVRVLSTDNAISGVAEIGVMQVAPAINNALARLIGRRLHSLPMLPEQVLKAMHN